MYKYKREYNLEDIAKRIFGSDLVSKAYIVANGFSYSPNKEKIIETHFEKSSQFFIEQNHTNNRLDVDTELIIIEFTNGRKVLFEASEWFVMVNIDEKNSWEELQPYEQ